LKLLTKTLEQKLVAAHKAKAESATVLAKFFTPDAQCSWFITEYDPQNRMFFGFCNLGNDDMAELGYVGRDELERVTGLFGLHVERDICWNPVELSRVISFEVR
jgi:hypothetical protein